MAAFLALAFCHDAWEQSLTAPDLGKLTATCGVSQIEGAGGGGLMLWAFLITGYGSRDSYGSMCITLH